MAKLIATLYVILGVLPFLVTANTETYLLQVPRYFNIPSHPKGINPHYLHHRSIHTLNKTHSVLLDFPIQNKPPPANVSNTVSLVYNPLLHATQTLLVRLNNYHDATFKSDDLLYIKLCWPATTPVDFRFNHAFHKLSDLHLEHTQDSFDIYLEVEISSDIHTYSTQYNDSIKEIQFQLYITKMPCKLIPIPLELYVYIVYVVDLSILLVTIVPWLLGILFT
mmetsp:Transcript_9141/g.11419  ORF Transcript_9141/g.11419 Transcript_9141/m.11419 type:complete len:222 (-) Transcript_9141:912-1577(-)